jgi:hypothetical protein
MIKKNASMIHNENEDDQKATSPSINAESNLVYKRAYRSCKSLQSAKSSCQNKKNKLRNGLFTNLSLETEIKYGFEPSKIPVKTQVLSNNLTRTLYQNVLPLVDV